MDILPSDIINLLAEYAGQIGALMLSHVDKRIFRILNRSMINDYSIMADAARLNSLNVIKYLVDNDCQIHESCFMEFAAYGNLHAISYLYNYINTIPESVLLIAITYGHLHILDFAYHLNIIIPHNLGRINSFKANFTAFESWLKLRPNIKIDLSTLSEMAASVGNLEIFKRVAKIDNYHNLCGIAISNGRINIVKYIHFIDNKIWDIDINLSDDLDRDGFVKCIHLLVDFYSPDVDNAVNAAIEFGDIKLLEYCLDAGNILPQYIPYTNSLEMVKYLHKNGCVLSEDIITAAIENNNIEIVEFYVENSNYFTKEMLINSHEYDIQIIKLLYTAAAKYDIYNIDDEGLYNYCGATELCEHIILEKIKFLHSINPGTLDVMSTACSSVSPNILKWTIENDYLVGDSYLDATICDDICIIEYLCNHTNTIIDYSRLLLAAIKNGACKIIAKICEQGPRIYTCHDLSASNYYECLLAAANRHLDALKLLKKFGYGWDSRIIITAIDKESLNILRYAVNNNCPLPEKKEILAIKNISPQINRFLISRKLI